MLLELKNVTKCFNKQVVFKNMNFTIEDTGIYFITGLSGSGKSTLLNIIAGFETIDNGERIINKNTSIAYIFQNYELIQDMTVKENLFLSLDLFSRVPDEDDLMMLNSLGLEQLMNRYPDELSGGQKQRVGIARALLQHPDLIICDEPTEALDSVNKKIVLEQLKQLSKHKAIVIVSHDKTALDEYYDYKFMIKNQNVIQEEMRTNTHKIILNKKENKTIQKKVFKNTINKLFLHSSCFYTILLSCFILIQFLLFQCYISLFTVNETWNAANKDIVYVTLYPKGNVEDIDSKYSDKIPYILFNPITLNGKSLKVNLLPLLDESYNFSQSNGLVINQNAAEQLENILNEDVSKLIGKEITFSYYLNQEKKSVKLVLCDIIHEPDVTKPQWYYNHNYMMSYMQTNMIGEITVYEYLMDNGTAYALQYPIEEVDIAYQYLKGIDGIYAYHSILTPLEEQENQKIMYQILFIFIQVFLLIITIFYTIFYARKATLKHAGTLSIMISCGVNKDVLKKHYFKYKTKLFVGGVCLSYIAAGGIGFILFDEYVDFACLSFMGIYAICIVLLFSIVLHLILKKIKIRNINMILKEDKDI